MLTMRQYPNVAARMVIGRDDSVDCDDNSWASPGLRLLISDGTNREEVLVSRVLDRGRIRLADDLTRTYEDPCMLGYTDWTLSPGKAIAKKGQVYYTRAISSFDDLGGCQIFIRLDAGEIKAEFRESDFGAWEELRLLETVECGCPYKFCSLRAGSFQLRLTALSEEAAVRHIALLPNAFNLLPAGIRTTKLVHPEAGASFWRDLLWFESSEFLAAYGDFYAQTEYGIFRPGESEPLKIINIRQREFTVIEDDVKLEYSGAYEVRFRHQSDLGEWSLWSDPVKVNASGLRAFFGFKNAKNAGGFGEKPFGWLGIYPRKFGFSGARMSAGFGETKIEFAVFI